MESAWLDNVYHSISTLPVEAWKPHVVMLFRKSCCNRDHKAIKLIMHHGFHIDTPLDSSGRRGIDYTLWGNQPKEIELLCAFGASLQRTLHIRSPLESAIADKRSEECIQMLLANGARLSNLRPQYYHKYVREHHVEFEERILACRAKIVIILGIRRFRKCMMLYDRFLLREIGFSIWATRRSARHYIPFEKKVRRACTKNTNGTK